MIGADQHHTTCDRQDDCVECGGCDCGLNERICTGQGCCSGEEYARLTEDED